MVALNFNAHALAFEPGLDTIEQGYEAAVSGITQEINRKKAAFYDYSRHIENGGEPTGERDDDGVLIWSQDQLLQGTIFVAEEALMSLRKAYAVAIYHHWERSALQWTNRKNEKHDVLARRVLAMGYPIDPHLHVVRDLANLLKHDNDRWGLKLHESWPDVFPANFRPPLDGARSVNWYDRVALSANHIKSIMKTVRASGPNNPPMEF
ncbi:hypothetical protein QP185_07570 [Sphingomonas aerolata]|uniref:hypothetical protein n=1 Tax=Sphingomonas aerolata TaxID=185951 RepID=UPI002FE3818B